MTSRFSAWGTRTKSNQEQLLLFTEQILQPADNGVQPMHSLWEAAGHLNKYSQVLVLPSLLLLPCRALTLPAGSRKLLWLGSENLGFERTGQSLVSPPLFSPSFPLSLLLSFFLPSPLHLLSPPSPSHSFPSSPCLFPFSTSHSIYTPLFTFSSRALNGY